MKYGFLIDHRKCIGCHACTLACKSEHNVPVGVNRTWVKYIERGTYPNSRRFFTVMRCNHCEDAPCVKICPVGALFTREDGIVDFNKERCIGCKSCTMACPYDSVYIDPNTDTAAKCNFCAHRIDMGLNPACVNVCPEQAIIAGDLDDSASAISKMIGREQVQSRKVEKGTIPKLYYINADAASLNPMAAPPAQLYQQTEQSGGVGHYAKFNKTRIKPESAQQYKFAPAGSRESLKNRESYGAPVLDGAGESLKLLNGNSRRTHDAPSKGILWGWELPAYLWTKAIAGGAFILTAISLLMGGALSPETQVFIGVSTLAFVVLTSMALVKDLDKPTRFLYIFLRPQYSSWLTRGGLIIASFGFFAFLWIASILAANYMNADLAVLLQNISLWGGIASGTMLAIYTAFLLGQAKGIDFWQTPLAPFHMAIQSLLAGAGFLLAVNPVLHLPVEFLSFLNTAFKGTLIANTIILLVEILSNHPTADGKLTVKIITGKKYGLAFFAGVLLAGNLVPLFLSVHYNEIMLSAAGALALAGFYLTEHIWIRAPQLIAKS